MKTTLESKGLLSTYKNEIISVSKKQFPINEPEIKTDTRIEEYPENQEKFREEFKKIRKSNKVEDEIRGELLYLATKLAEDSSLNSSPVAEHKAFVNLCKNKKVRACWG